MMSEMPDASDTSEPDAVVQSSRHTLGSFDVALCGQCYTCRSFFPCEQLYMLQIQDDEGYQDTGRLICFDCHRVMNHRVYQARELTRQETAAARRNWLEQQHP